MTRSEIQALDIEMGARLRAFRLAAKISQEELGGHCGITFQQIQKYEKGANRISMSRAIQISRVLGIDPALFFDKFQPEPGTESMGVTALLTEIDFLKARLEKIRALTVIKDKK